VVLKLAHYELASSSWQVGKLQVGTLHLHLHTQLSPFDYTVFIVFYVIFKKVSNEVYYKADSNEFLLLVLRKYNSVTEASRVMDKLYTYQFIKSLTDTTWYKT